MSTFEKTANSLIAMRVEKHMYMMHCLVQYLNGKACRLEIGHHHHH